MAATPVLRVAGSRLTLCSPVPADGPQSEGVDCTPGLQSSLTMSLCSLCLLMLQVYHAGLFLTLLLGQIGVQGRRQGYWG